MRALRQRLTSFAVVVSIEPVNVAISEMDAIQVAALGRGLGGEVGTVVQIPRTTTDGRNRGRYASRGPG